MWQYWYGSVVPFLNQFSKDAEKISKGLGVTLEMFFVTLMIAIPLGLIVSLGAISRRKWINWPVKTYIWLLRGTPLMLQLLFVYYGIPVLLRAIPVPTQAQLNNLPLFLPYLLKWLPMLPKIKIDRLLAGFIAFALNYAAYFAEIFRAGIQSIDKGQFEAAHALGFGKTKTMWRIILPQTVSRMLPPVGNEAISLIKDTSLLSVIALRDIFTHTKSIVSSSANISAFFVAAVFYLVMTFVITMLFSVLEKWFAGVRTLFVRIQLYVVSAVMLAAIVITFFVL